MEVKQFDLVLGATYPLKPSSYLLVQRTKFYLIWKHHQPPELEKETQRLKTNFFLEIKNNTLLFVTKWLLANLLQRNPNTSMIINKIMFENWPELF